MIKKIDVNLFKNEVLEEKDKLIVVDFYADWCGPCRLTSPIIDELANEFKQVKFVKINVDENPQLANQYSVFSIPTFLLFKNGEIVDQLIGAAGKERFISLINKHIQ
jgi:thioredoxin 1